MSTIHRYLAITLIAAAALVAGCSSSGSKRGGGYYKDDGPGSNIPANIEAIPDAVPKIEVHSRGTSRPYVIFGKRYVPLTGERAFRQTGRASWYGRKFHGNKTANGETYNMYAMTAAHPTLPIPSYARVTRVSNGRSIIVRINDRGPFHSGRIIDLSYTAAAKLDLIKHGSGQVVVEAITNADIARAQAQGTGFAQATAAVRPTTGAAAPAMAAHETKPVSTVITATAAPSGNPASTNVTTAAVAPPPPPVPDALAVLNLTSQPSTQPAPTAQPVLATTSHTPESRPAQQLAPSASAVFLQFGAFGAQDSAISLAERLNQQIGAIESRQAHIQPAAGVYRVQIGPYASRTEAVNAALRIQEQTGKQATMAIR